MKYYYRLTAFQQKEITQNLIDIIEKDGNPTSDAREFIGNGVHTWINQ